MIRRAAMWAILVGLGIAAYAAGPSPNTFEIQVDASGGLKYREQAVDIATLQESLKQLFKEHPDAVVVIRLPEGYNPAILQPPMQAALQAGFSDNLMITTDSPGADPSIALPGVSAEPAPGAETKPAQPAPQAAPQAAAEPPHALDLRNPGTMVYDGQTADESQLRDRLAQLYKRNPTAAVIIYLSEGYAPSVLEAPLKWVTQTGLENVVVTTDAPGSAEKNAQMLGLEGEPISVSPGGSPQASPPSAPVRPYAAALPIADAEILPEPEFALPAPDPARILVYDTLLKAVAAGDLYATLGQLAAGQQIYLRDDLGRDAFLLAAENGYNAILPYVHRAINDIESRDHQGNTALHLAAAGGQNGTIEWLARHGADKEARNKEELTPLLTAAKTGRAEAFMALLRFGANRSVSCESAANCSAAGLASREKHWNITMLMHYLGIHDNIHFAASVGDLGLVRALLSESPGLLEAEDLVNATPLFYAARTGQAEVVQYLAGQGANMDAANFEGQTVMGMAIASGNAESVKALVNAGLEPSAYIERRTGTRPLHWLAQRNALAMAATLLDLGAQPDEPNLAGETALHTAVTAKNKDFAALLLERGASVDIQRKDGSSPLHLAAELGLPDLADVLVRHQANIQLVNSHGETPLHRAAEKKHREMADWLVDHGARLDSVSTQGETALHIAARLGNTALAQDLAGRGAPLETIAASGFTPFLSAINAGQWPAAEALLKLGANRLQADREGNTALHIAIERQWITLLPQFETLGIPWDAVNRKNRTPLFLALRTDRPDATDWLLAHGAAVEHLDCFGQTPLFAAVDQGGLHVIKRLLSAGAGINIQDQWGRSPLHYAARRGNPMLMNLLVEAGGRLDIADVNGQLPIHFAANAGHWGAIQFQLLRGIAVDSTDIEGRTPLFFTMKNGFFMASRNLLRRGASFATHDRMGYSPIAMVHSFLEAYEPVLYAMPDPEVERDNRYHALLLLGREALTEEAARTAERGGTAAMQTLTAFYPAIVNQFFLGETLLHRAARAGQLEMVRLLVKAGADINRNECTPEGYAALHEAARYGHTEVAAFLLESGADPAQKAANGETPIDTARNAGKEALFPKR